MANKHAHVLLLKRDAEFQDGNYPSAILKRSFTTDERKERAANGHAMPDGSFPIDDKQDLENAVRAIGRAKDPAKAKAHIRTRARALGATDMLPDTWSKRDSGNAVMKFFASKDAKIAKGYASGQSVDFDTAQAAAEGSELVSGLMDEVNEAVCALGQSIWSIQSDDDVTDKGEEIAASLKQFGEHVQTIVPEGVENAFVAQALAEAGYTINPQGGIEISKGADSMSYKAIAKSLGLPETATEADVLAKMAEVTKAAKLNEQIAKMSLKHKAFMDHPDAKMPKGGKEAFAEMEPSERDAHIKENPIEDDEDENGVEKRIAKGLAFRTAEGVILTKKDFGSDAGFEFAKSQAAKLAKAEKEAEEERDERKKKEKKEVAEKSMSLIGKSDEIGSVLHRVTKLDPKLGAEVEALLKGANDLLAKSDTFKELGSGVRKSGTAAQAIIAKADEIRKANPKLSIEKAKTMARDQNPDLKKAEYEEANSAKRAA